MPNGTYGGVRGKGAKAKTLAPRPTRYDCIAKSVGPRLGVAAMGRGRLNADYADYADLFRNNQRNQRLVKANELVRFAEVPPCFGKTCANRRQTNLFDLLRCRHVSGKHVQTEDKRTCSIC